MNPLDIEGVTFEDMCDWLMLSPERVKSLLDREKITVMINFETRQKEYYIQIFIAPPPVYGVLQ